jgi:hypothetical protein
MHLKTSFMKWLKFLIRSLLAVKKFMNCKPLNYKQVDDNE